MDFLEGAIIGAIAGGVGVVAITLRKNQQFSTIKKSITEPNVEYTGNFHLANADRYQKKMKFFDSYGVLYLAGNNLYYKFNPNIPPMIFNLNECILQEEPKWKMLKWFSITTPSGEKYYFDSNSMGFFVNNSDETLKALNLFKAKQSTQSIHQPPPPPPKI